MYVVLVKSIQSASDLTKHNRFPLHFGVSAQFPYPFGPTKYSHLHGVDGASSIKGFGITVVEK